MLCLGRGMDRLGYLSVSLSSPAVQSYVTPSIAVVWRSNVCCSQHLPCSKYDMLENLWKSQYLAASSCCFVYLLPPWDILCMMTSFQEQSDFSCFSCAESLQTLNISNDILSGLFCSVVKLMSACFSLDDLNARLLVSCLQSMEALIQSSDLKWGASVPLTVQLELQRCILCIQPEVKIHLSLWSLCSGLIV